MKHTLNRACPGRQQRYLVSGTGDGGLVDLLRLRITDFREDRIGMKLPAETRIPPLCNTTAESFERLV
jgi:hypothetical protein